MPTSGGMYIQYGDYIHPSGEVNLEKVEAVPWWSPRNERWATLYKFHCRGDLMLTPTEDDTVRGDNAARQALMNTKIDAFVNAYSVNDKTFGLYHGDNSPTRHVLDQNSSLNISGTRVLYRSWSEGGGDQYVTARTFYLIMGALYAHQDSGLYRYEERLRIVGTAANWWEWVGTPLVIPIQQQFQEFTSQRIEQFGYIVGLNTWPLGNVPAPLFPAWEHRDRRAVHYDYPEWYGADYQLYGYRWHYIMEAPTGQVAIPNLH